MVKHLFISLLVTASALICAEETGFPGCGIAIREGIYRNVDLRNSEWTVTSRSQIISKAKDGIELASEKAELEAVSLLKSRISPDNKKLKQLSGVVVTKRCVHKDFVYVEIKVDANSVRASQSVKDHMEKSFAENPTPKSNAGTHNRQVTDFSELEESLKKMQRERVQ
jgi:hypothetical protein